MAVKIKFSNFAHIRPRSRRPVKRKKDSSALSSIFYLVIIAVMGGGSFVYDYFIRFINKTGNPHTRRKA